MVSLYSLIYEDVDIESVMEANPIASVIQGFHTRKILKGMTPDERKELGRFLRDKDFIELSRKYHTGRDKFATWPIQKFIRQRIDDPKLAKKITRVALDPKFDQARNRLVTKALVPRDTLPHSDEPLKITPRTQQRIDADAAREKKKNQLTRWLRTAKIKNPETGNTILVRSGLQSDPDSEVYKAAHAALNAHRKTLKMRAVKPRVKPKWSSKSGDQSNTPKISDRPVVGLPKSPSYSSPSYGGGFSGGGGFSFGGGGGFSGGGGGANF